MSDNLFKRIAKAYIGDQAITAEFVKDKISAAVGDNAFVNLVSGLGTSRDKASAGKYMPAPRMTVKDLNNIYRSDHIAKKIIEKPTEDAVSGGWYYSKLDDKQNQALIKASKEFRLGDVLRDALAFSRLHGWSYIIVGSTDSDESLSDPIDIRFGNLSFFKVMKRDEIKPKKDGEFLSDDITKGRGLQPEFYQIGSDYSPEYIHHSRVFRVNTPGRIMDDDGMPIPLLQVVYDVLTRNMSAGANTSSLIYESKTDVIKIENLAAKLSQSGMAGLSGLIQRLTAMATLKGNHGMIILDKGEEYESKHYAFGGLSDLIREFRIETSGAAEMPYSMLFGQSPSGMNATGDFDVKTYFGSVSSMQDNVLRPIIEQLISIILLSLGIDVDNVGLVFEPIWREDRETLSKIERSNAERDAVYLERGIITEYIAAQQLVDDGTYTTIDAEHIEMLKGMGGQAYELTK